MIAIAVDMNHSLYLLTVWLNCTSWQGMFVEETLNLSCKTFKKAFLSQKPVEELLLNGIFYLVVSSFEK